MDFGDLIWFLFVALWLFSGVLSRIAKAFKSRSQPAARDKRAPVRPGVPKPVAARPAPTRPAPRAVPPPVPPVPQPSTPQDALSQLLKQFGIDIAPASEKPVAAEHRRTPAEHQRTASEARRSMGEHDHTPGWHDRTASEVRRTASETQLVASEHRLSEGEHVGGEIWAERPELAIRDARPARGAGIAAHIRADLASADSLARAFVLREILGPPIGLRSGDRDR